jgi:hypothetical protein
LEVLQACKLTTVSANKAKMVYVIIFLSTSKISIYA